MNQSNYAQPPSGRLQPQADGEQGNPTSEQRVRDSAAVSSHQRPITTASVSSRADDPRPHSEHGPPEEEELPPPLSVRGMYGRYQRYVGKIGLNILGPDADVDDLVQEVFVAAMRDAHKLRDQSRLRGWLATVAARMAVRMRRARTDRGRMTVATLDEPLEPAASEPSPESRAATRGTVEQLKSLPERLRTPWVLKNLEGKTLQAVAAECNCSQSTAQRRIAEAAARLRKLATPRSR